MVATMTHPGKPAMKRVRAIVTPAILLLLSAFVAHAQNENRTWHFGDGAGIHFPATGELPVPVPRSAIVTHSTDRFGYSEAIAAASISDRHTGRVLFYTNGVTMWDSTHRVMQNGERLLECPPPGNTNIFDEKTSAGQGVLIVPAPCDTNRYYVFSNDWCESYQDVSEGKQGLYYSVVDMRLNRGRGGVVEKQVPLLRPTTGGLTATMQSNGRDYWIVTQKVTTFGLYVFPLTCEGLGSPVIMSAPDYLQPVWGSDKVPRHWWGYDGTIQISPAGNSLAVTYVVSKDLNPLPRPDDNYVDFYRFDPATGRASDPVSVQGLGVNGWRAHDVAFSPDGTKIYWIEKGDYIYQADVMQHDAGAIKASKTRLGSYIGSAADVVQLGPDGRIYFGNHEDTMLSVVHQPNLSGAACQVEMRVVSLGGREMKSSLPNTITSNLFGRDRVCSVEADFSAAAVVDTVCAGEPLLLVDRSRGATGGVIWLTPGGRENRIESPGSAEMMYDTPGEYSLTQIAVASRCGAPAYDTAYGRVVVLPSPSVAVGRDLWICGATDTTVQLSAEATGDRLRYEWQPAAGLSCVDCPSPTASPEQTTTYVLTVTQPNGCTASDSITVWVGEYRAELALAPEQAEPGDTLWVPLVIALAPPGGETERLIVTVTSDSTQFLLREEFLTFAQLLEGTALEGWRVVRSAMTPGSLELELESSNGRVIELIEGDTLLRIPGIVLLGSRSTAALSARLGVPALECVRFDSIATHLEIVMCGREYRSVRIGDFTFDAPRAVASGSSTPAIEFSIPWDAPIELALYDMTGARVAVLIDGEQAAGRYLAELPEVPSGSYFVCLVLGGRVYCTPVVVRAPR